MVPLNLPSFEYKIKKSDGKLWIFDIIRKRYFLLNPEEWVRQHFLNYMINTKLYPKSLIRVEGGIYYNQLQKRTDIVVFDREGSAWMIVECKAPDIKISEKALFQVSAYNASMRAKYITVTNGLHHLFAQTDWDTNTTSWLDDMPAFPL